MSVDHRWQQQGVGTALLNAGETWFQQRGAQIVVVNSGQQRAQAHQFYQRRGYVLRGFSFRKQLS